MEKEHLEVLLEDIKGKFDLVLEGHDVLNKKIDDTRHVLHEEIALNTSMIRELNKKVEHIRDDLTGKIAHIRDDLTEKIENNTAQIITLGKKIDSAEARLSEKIAKVATDLAEHRADTEQHQTGYKVSES